MATDLSDLLTQLPNTQAAVQTASAAATTATSGAVAADADKSARLTADEADQATITQQTGTAGLQAQTDTRNLGDIMAGGIDNKNNLLATLAQSVHDNASKAQIARDELVRTQEAGNHNIFVAALNHFHEHAVQKDVNTYTNAAVDAASEFNSINNSLTTAATTNDKIAAVQSTATVAATTDMAVNKLAALKDDADRQGLVDNASLLGDVAKYSVDALGNLERVASTQDQVARTNLAVGEKAASDASDQDMINIANIGAKLLGLPPITGKGQWQAYSKIPGMRSQLEAMTNAGASVLRNNTTTTMPDGTVVPAQGTASIAPTAGEAFVTSKIVKAQPNGADDRVFARRESVFKDVNKLLGGDTQNIKPDQYISKGQELINTYTANMQKDIESEPFQSNPHYQPGISTVTRLAPQIAADPNFQAVFGNLRDAGTDVPEAELVANSALLAARANPGQVKQIGALVKSYYNVAVTSNRLAGGLYKFALPRVDGYNVQLPTNIGGSPAVDKFAAHILRYSQVDMTSDQFTDYLSRNLLMFPKGGAQ